jgi:hypothetical protein
VVRDSFGLIRGLDVPQHGFCREEIEGVDDVIQMLPDGVCGQSDGDEYFDMTLRQVCREGGDVVDVCG